MTWHRLERGLEGACVLLLLALMLVTCVDVVGRYLFEAPLAGAFELTELMLGALVFAALPLTSARGGHVEVDLFVDLMPERIGRLLTRIAGLFCSLVLVFFAWRLLDLGLSLWSEGSRTLSLAIPRAPVAFLGALACLASAVLMPFRRI